MTHGTTTGYVYHKCRCPECLRAWATYNQQYRARVMGHGRCISCTEEAEPGRRFCLVHRMARWKARS